MIYAIEGNIYATGAALEWTAALLGLGGDVGRVDALARSCATSGGVCFVPALSGLGAPYWDPGARGLISGLTRAAGPAEVSRATFEAVAHQVADVLDWISGLGLDLDTVHADGGAIRSDLLASLVADISGTPSCGATSPRSPPSARRCWPASEPGSGPISTRRLRSNGARPRFEPRGWPNRPAATLGGSGRRRFVAP